VEQQRIANLPPAANKHTFHQMHLFPILSLLQALCRVFISRCLAYLAAKLVSLSDFCFFQQGSYGQGILRESGITERVREKFGNFKILLTRPIIYALFSQFLSASGGFAPRPAPGLRPCKHCRLVYIAYFTMEQSL